MRSPDPRRQLVDRCEAAIRDEERRRLMGAVAQAQRANSIETRFNLDTIFMTDREKIELILEIQEGKVR